MNSLRLEPFVDGGKRAGDSRSTVYRAAQLGEFVQPIKKGRLSLVLSSEVDAIISARVAGKSPIELRALVAELHARRSTLA